MLDADMAGISPENAIAIVQTVLTVLTLKKLAKGHWWLALGGLTALELPVRIIDDNQNPLGRETFLGLTSFSYILLVSLTRLLVTSARSLGRLFARGRMVAVQPESAPGPATVTPETIISFIEEKHPTFDDLVAEFGESRDALFAVLKTRASPYGDSIVVGPVN